MGKNSRHPQYKWQVEHSWLCGTSPSSAPKHNNKTHFEFLRRLTLSGVCQECVRVEQCHWTDAIYRIRIRSRWPSHIILYSRRVGYSHIHTHQQKWIHPARQGINGVYGEARCHWWWSSDDTRAQTTNLTWPPLDETPTAQTARATGAITIKLGNHQHSQADPSLFYHHAVS